MYSNPRHVRKHLVPVRVNDFNNETLERLAEKHGKQKAAIAHALLEVALRMASAELEERRRELDHLIGLLN
jgi:hypothetical protein